MFSKKIKEIAQIFKIICDIAKYFHPTKNGKETPETLVEGTGKLLWLQSYKGHE